MAFGPKSQQLASPSASVPSLAWLAEIRLRNRAAVSVRFFMSNRSPKERYVSGRVAALPARLGSMKYDRVPFIVTISFSSFSNAAFGQGARKSVVEGKRV